jgi:hypothetical protein
MLKERRERRFGGDLPAALEPAEPQWDEDRDQLGVPEDRDGELQAPWKDDPLIKFGKKLVRNLKKKLSKTAMSEKAAEDVNVAAAVDDDVIIVSRLGADDSYNHRPDQDTIVEDGLTETVPLTDGSTDNNSAYSRSVPIHASRPPTPDSPPPMLTLTLPTIIVSS